MDYESDTKFHFLAHFFADATCLPISRPLLSKHLCSLWCAVIPTAALWCAAYGIMLLNIKLPELFFIVWSGIFCDVRNFDFSCIWMFWSSKNCCTGPSAINGNSTSWSAFAIRCSWGTCICQCKTISRHHAASTVSCKSWVREQSS